ncbi:MAG: heme exporter protein CcmD [Alphaproteobacteria bacterium]
MFDFKYAEFIIPAFVITAVVFGGMILLSVNHARHWRRRYEELTRSSKTPRRTAGWPSCRLWRSWRWAGSSISMPSSAIRRCSHRRWWARWSRT